MFFGYTLALLSVFVWVRILCAIGTSHRTHTKKAPSEPKFDTTNQEKNKHVAAAHGTLNTHITNNSKKVTNDNKVQTEQKLENIA